MSQNCKQTPDGAAYDAGSGGDAQPRPQPHGGAPYTTDVPPAGSHAHHTDAAAAAGFAPAVVGHACQAETIQRSAQHVLLSVESILMCPDVFI